jgi:hypothetical protein
MKIKLSVSEKVAIAGMKNPNNRQLTIRGADEASAQMIEDQSASKKRPYQVDLNLAGGVVTLVQRDTHALWAGHQSKESAASFTQIWDKLAEKPGSTATIEATFTPTGGEVEVSEEIEIEL